MPSITSLIKDKDTFYFVSPHLDDAILSAGGLISYLADKVKIKIMNVFTTVSPGPETFYAKRYVSSCGYVDSALLFKERKREDRRVYKKLNIVPIYLNYIDAFWRKKENKRNIFSSFIPELNHIYPTRFHARTGEVNSADNEMMKRLKNDLKSVIVERRSVIFCPFGIGRHVDHIIIRSICSELFANVVYWSDYPYNLREKICEKNYSSITFKKNLNIKKDLISEYKTQLNPLFKNNSMEIPNEIYLLNKN